MLIKNFRFFLLCSLSIVFLFSCSSDFTEGESIQEEANKRDIIDAIAISKDEGCRSAYNPARQNTYHAQNLDLTGKNLKRGTRTVEEFLTDLGFDISVLCTGNCDDGKDCKVTNFFNSINSDLMGTHPSGNSKIITKVTPRSWSQDISDVDMIIRAVCKCK